MTLNLHFSCSFQLDSELIIILLNYFFFLFFLNTGKQKDFINSKPIKKRKRKQLLPASGRLLTSRLTPSKLLQAATSSFVKSPAPAIEETELCKSQQSTSSLIMTPSSAK